MVAQEQAVVAPRPSTGLLHHHQHHGLDCVTVARNTVPVIPLQLQRQVSYEYNLNEEKKKKKKSATCELGCTLPWMVQRTPIFWQKA